MTYNKKYGLFVADDENLRDFCKKLIAQQRRLQRKIVGEYADVFIIAGSTDTVQTLIDKYREEDAKDKSTPMRKSPKGDIRKNASGYPDPTAYRAIMNLDKESSRRMKREEKPNNGK